MSAWEREGERERKTGIEGLRRRGIISEHTPQVIIQQSWQRKTTENYSTVNCKLWENKISQNQNAFFSRLLEQRQCLVKTREGTNITQLNESKRNIRTKLWSSAFALDCAGWCWFAQHGPQKCPTQGYRFIRYALSHRWSRWRWCVEHWQKSYNTSSHLSLYTGSKNINLKAFMCIWWTLCTGLYWKWWNQTTTLSGKKKRKKGAYMFYIYVSL